MKPTIHSLQIPRRSNSDVAHRTSSGLPKTDYQFQPDRNADFGDRCHGGPSPSFRGISQDYFNNEARGHFVSEASVFVLMLVTAAVSVIQGARGAMHILRAYGIL